LLAFDVFNQELHTEYEVRTLTTDQGTGLWEVDRRAFHHL